jgi:hypothetical protein
MKKVVFLLAFSFLFSCTKEEQTPVPDCRNCIVVVEDNRKEMQLRCQGLAHSPNNFEVRNITTERHCRPFPATKTEMFWICQNTIQYTRRTRYECN